VYSEDVDEVFKGSEIVVVATDWPQFKELDFEYLSTLMKEKRLLDARNYLDVEYMSNIFKFDNLGA
jgi:UDPglucose 6-dehydrogenase